MTRRSERGAGLLSTVVGVGVVMGLVAVAANVAIGLWARTTVDAVTEDAARRVARAPHDADLAAVAAHAGEDARRLLGRHGQRIRLDWLELGPDRVQLRVRSPGAPVLPGVSGSAIVVGEVDRVVSVRRERPR
jgi:hypothetical protein